MRLIPIYLGALLLPWSASSLAAPIKWGFSPSDPPPYVVMDGASLQSSLTKDLGQLVANATDRSVQFIPVPNNRIDDAFNRGQIDIICNTQPSWHTHPEQMLWSEVLYEDADVIATRSTSQPPSSINDLRGAMVGTTLGYHYSNKLTDAFESGQLTRHDVRDLNTRLKMLERRRLDATVELRRPLQHYLLGKPADIRISDWEIERFALRCATPRQPENHRRLIDAIHRLLEEGQITDLVDRYQ